MQAVMQVMTIGGATLDVVVSGPPLQYAPGSKQDLESITLGIGGGAVNASLAFKACGAHVRIVCALGADAEAAWLQAALERAGVDISGVQSLANQLTGKAVIHLDENAEATVWAQRGAGAALKPAQALQTAGPVDVLYVTALSAAAEAELSHALRRRTARPRLLAVNPGMRQIAAASAALADLLAGADLICLNEAEARAWATTRGMAVPEDLLADASAWLGALRLHPAQALLVTLGRRGALFHDGSRAHFMPAQAVPVQSTLGAGDAFNATLTAHWAQGCPAPVALAAARAYCARVLQSATANLAGPRLAARPLEAC